MTLLWLLIKILKLWNYKKWNKIRKYIVINAVPIQMTSSWFIVIIDYNIEINVIAKKKIEIYDNNSANSIWQ